MKRMCSAVGHEVGATDRSNFEPLALDVLTEGMARAQDAEVKALPPPRWHVSTRRARISIGNQPLPFASGLTLRFRAGLARAKATLRGFRLVRNLAYREVRGERQGAGITCLRSLPLGR